MKRRDFIRKITVTGIGAALIPVTATAILKGPAEVGRNFSTFEMKFHNDFFRKHNMFSVDDTYVRVLSDPIVKDGLWTYECRLITNDQEDHIHLDSQEVNDFPVIAESFT